MELKYLQLQTNTMLIAETVAQKCSSKEALCKYVANLQQNTHSER